MSITLSREKSIAICMHAVSYNNRVEAVVVLAGQILIVLKIPLNHLSLMMPYMKLEGIAGYSGRHSIEDTKLFTGGCWLLISLCMGENSFEDSTQRMSVNRKGGTFKGPLKIGCHPPSEVTVPGWKKPWWESTSLLLCGI